LTLWLLISELMIDTQFLEERVPFTLHNQKVRHCTGFKLSFVWYGHASCQPLETTSQWYWEHSL